MLKESDTNFKIINSYNEQGQIPKEWNDAVCVLLFKKGDRKTGN